MFSPLRLAAAATAASVIALPAFAGSAEPATPDTPVSPAAPVIDASPDWTGFYTGVQLGFAEVDTDLAGNDDDVIGGIVGGYDHDFGQWVVGGGLDYDFADIDLNASGGALEEVFRVKGRAGYKIGQGLLYATTGYAWADTNSFGDDDGYFVGGGYEYRVSDQFSIGGEVLYHEFDDFGNLGSDVEATTVQLRGTFRF
ncbi:MAG: outer membrane beta-barrel protein [Roseovarius sp.]|nr:outer membrane beta-barrel protein [Roseovarius sp.]